MFVYPLVKPLNARDFQALRVAPSPLRPHNKKKPKLGVIEIEGLERFFSLPWVGSTH